jgi:hypothetical protein
LKILSTISRFPPLYYQWLRPKEVVSEVVMEVSEVEEEWSEGEEEVFIPPPPPRIFTKVAARYAPLVLPVPLHDLPENYMKNYQSSQEKET